MIFFIAMDAHLVMYFNGLYEFMAFVFFLKHLET